MILHTEYLLLASTVTFAAGYAGSRLTEATQELADGHAAAVQALRADPIQPARIVPIRQAQPPRYVVPQGSPEHRRMPVGEPQEKFSKPYSQGECP